ncbi:MAG: pyridoxamine 5'-phosphate oxidase family protein [Clostridiales Family XIII bacterium]|jgi:uncharacterized pyridoxamine 5'-phosphate oxidase family protein|nr:pyridoxamine 5'-phosphate oxidase family protein [Clostridiales Family XIII bacterium]
MKKTLKFLQDNHTYFLATIDGDQARVRPFGAVLEFEGKLYFCTSNQKDVYKQLKANPKVEVSAYDGKNWWLRTTAIATFDDRKEVKEAMLQANPFLNNIYSLDDGKFTLFYLKDAVSKFESMAGEEASVELF